MDMSGTRRTVQHAQSSDIDGNETFIITIIRAKCSVGEWLKRIETTLRSPRERAKPIFTKQSADIRVRDIC